MLQSVVELNLDSRVFSGERDNLLEAFEETHPLIVRVLRLDLFSHISKTCSDNSCIFPEWHQILLHYQIAEGLVALDDNDGSRDI